MGLASTLRRFIVPNSFSDLNDYAAASGLEFEDSRPAKVIFDRDANLVNDVQLTITSTTVAVSPPIEILEIINHATANVRYRVEIKTIGADPLIGSTLTWHSLPGGTVLTNVGSVYTLTGLTRASSWNTIRTFTWNLPGNYATRRLWFLEISITYYDQALATDVTVNWNAYDSRFYYLARLESSFSISPDLRRRRGFVSQNFPARFIVDADQGPATLKRGIINAQSVSTLFCSGDDRSFASAALTNVSSLSLLASARLNRRFVPKNLTTAFTLSANVSSYSIIRNMIGVARGYFSNTNTQMFSAIIPYFDDPIGTSYQVVFRAQAGDYFGNSTGSSFAQNYSISGNQATINAAFTSVYFFPAKNKATNTTATYDIIRNGILIYEGTLTINIAGGGAIATTNYAYSTSTTWFPTILEQLYGQLDYVLIGGGGGGGGGNLNAHPSYPGTGNGGSGGAAGSAVTGTITSISGAGYFLSIGAGGNGGASNASTKASGATGGNTTAFGATATGGDGGGRGGSYGANGSQGGSNANYGGSTGTSNSSLVPWAGGGGAGSGGPGTGGGSGSQSPGTGGAAGVFLSMADGATGGNGGVGYRPAIGATGTGARGSSGFGYGAGGGGGGGYSTSNLSQAPGGAGTSGAVYIRTRA